MYTLCTVVALAIMSQPAGTVVGTVPALQGRSNSRTFLCSAITFSSVSPDQMAAARAVGSSMVD